MPLRCVVIEDDHQQNELLQFIAQQAGYEVEYHLHSEAFLKENNFNYACFLIDWKLPGISGFDLIPLIREKNPLAHIFIVTAHFDFKDISEGLETGADDYIFKPFHPEHLRMKLMNAHRKYSAIRAGNLNIGVQFIEDAFILCIEGKKVFLTETEYKIAKILYENRGSRVSRTEIEAQLSLNSENRIIDVHMHGIRKKIRETEVVIKNQRGIGYLWVK